MPNNLTTEELSAEVARRLFGCPVEPGYCSQHPKQPYASDHNAAFLVVAEMRKRGWWFELSDFGLSRCRAMFYRHGDLSDAQSSEVPNGEEPRAIYEAALAALDAQGEQG